MRKHPVLRIVTLFVLAAAVLAAAFLWRGPLRADPEPVPPAGTPVQTPPSMSAEPEEPSEPSAPSEPEAPPEPVEVPEEEPEPEPEPTPELEPEPTPEPEPEDPLLTLLDSMTLEEKVGQLFLARYPDAGAIELIASCHLGGYVLFARDFSGKSAQEVRDMTAALQAASPIPLLLAVDEEGGTVCRVSSNPQLRAGKFPSPQTLLAAGGLEALEADAKEKCALLADLGLNVNLAPVCDVSTDPGNFIYARSMGLDAPSTAEAVRTIVAAMEGVGAVLKHFPGYGDNSDTHTGSAYDDRPYEQFVNGDFLPFRAGIDAGAGAVMVSHNVVRCMDPELPASLSGEVHRILREELGFDGVAITDDLVMDAIGNWFTPEEAAVQAVLAGNDLLASSEVSKQYAAVLAAAQDGRIPPEHIDEAVLRVLRWKQDLGLLSK